MIKKVKNILCLVCTTFLLVSSCATSKEARTYQKTVDGNWLLKNVSTEGIAGKVNIQLFNEADFNCFVGSKWTFNKANNLGTYETNNGSQCTTIKRNIRWSVYEEKDAPKLFQFKRLDDKFKVMDNGDGFRFTIVQLDQNNMQLKSNIIFENRTAWIVYNFVKD